jgi:SAM-dependent methyltransferase
LGSYESGVRDALALIDQLALVRAGDRVLDVGCGPGAMVPGLLERAGSGGSYVGFDVHGPSIAWCRRRYAEDRRCRFVLARIASPYSTSDGGPIEQYSFPVADRRADFILAKSVFTHLMPSEAGRYLSEIQRTLQPGRPAVLTAFLFASGSRTGSGWSRFFRSTDSTGKVRWRSPLRPSSAVAYERDYFFALVERAGLRVQWLSAGFFPGDSDSLSGQDVLILGH